MAPQASEPQPSCRPRHGPGLLLDTPAVVADTRSVRVFGGVPQMPTSSSLVCRPSQPGGTLCKRGGALVGRQPDTCWASAGRRGGVVSFQVLVPPGAWVGILVTPRGVTRSLGRRGMLPVKANPWPMRLSNHPRSPSRPSGIIYCSCAHDSHSAAYIKIPSWCGDGGASKRVPPTGVRCTLPRRQASASPTDIPVYVRLARSVVITAE